MKEENKNQEKNENRIKKKSSNFFVQELKERMKIKKQSNLFKKAVDDEKARQLQQIEEECEVRNSEIGIKFNNLEEALNSDNPELVKEMLKNMKM